MTGRYERLRFLIPAVAALALLAGGLVVGGYRINLSASFPPGVYQVSPAGPLAAVCLTGRAAELAAKRGYLRRGTCPAQLEPVMKRVVAGAGDVVTVSAAGVSINGQALRNSAPAARDSEGRSMPELSARGSYNRRLAAGELWLASEYSAGSFDSRYFGPVDAGQVREYLTPVWIVSDLRPW